MRVGKVYEGRVTSVKDFGAFIEIMPGRDGLCHISELDDKYVGKVDDVCKVGDRLQVKVIAIDEHDRVKLSRKVLIREKAAAAGEPLAPSTPPPPREGGDRRPPREGGRPQRPQAARGAARERVKGNRV